MNTSLLLLVFPLLFKSGLASILCNLQENLCYDQSDNAKCKVRSINFNSRDCSLVSFNGNEKLESKLGELDLQIEHSNLSSQVIVNITFQNIRWRKAYLRLSDEINEDQSICKMYAVSNEVNLPLNINLYDACFWSYAKKLKAKTYLLNYKAENKQEIMFKKILFDIPDTSFFGNNVPINKRLVFSYVDFTSSYEIYLIIQPLPAHYNVTHYKIEVFREKDKKVLLLDVRLMAAIRMLKTLKFDYLTYNEEGFYFFSISVISDKCPEDVCIRTMTPKVYVKRRGTPLVIGIVGASFIIPFVLFIFHSWTRRYKSQDATEKILMLFKPSLDDHNEVVRTLARTIKNLTGIEVMLDPVDLTKTKQTKHDEKWCSDNLILATHIIYVAPPTTDENNSEFDYMTYTFLKEETKKRVKEKEIMVVYLPYSSRVVPAILESCVKFDLMGDFQKFINVFQPISPEFNYENNLNCMELIRKIKKAEKEVEECRNKEMPRIVVEEPGEVDVLL